MLRLEHKYVISAGRGGCFGDNANTKKQNKK